MNYHDYNWAIVNDKKTIWSITIILMYWYLSVHVLCISLLRVQRGRYSGLGPVRQGQELLTHCFADELCAEILTDVMSLRFAPAVAAAAVGYTAPRIPGWLKPTLRPVVVCASTCGEVAGTFQMGMGWGKLLLWLDVLNESEAQWAACWSVSGLRPHPHCSRPSLGWAPYL